MKKEQISNFEKYFLTIIIAIISLVGLWFSFHLFRIPFEEENKYLELLENIHPILPLIPGIATQIFIYTFILVYLSRHFPSKKKNQKYQDENEHKRKKNQKNQKSELENKSSNKTVISGQKNKANLVYILIFIVGITLSLIYILTK